MVNRCPYCGMPIRIVDLVDLTERQNAICDAIEHHKQQMGRKRAKLSDIKDILDLWADLREIDPNIPRSLSTIQKELAYLESLRVVSRDPRYPKSGYRLRRDNVAIVSTAVA